MTASAVLKYDGVLYPFDTSHKTMGNITDGSADNSTHTSTLNPNFIADNTNTGRILVSMSLTFCVGIIQVDV